MTVRFKLQALGLRLREVPGDGNCLFRALGDQLEGHSRNHLKHRQETVDYMIKQREDFEPFVEDDVPFEKHVSNLAKPGTFAGNDAIVAFARNNQMNVVIHQLNAPLWQIRGTDESNVRELHIAYRHGEHYDSVRRTNDNSEAPANLQTQMLCKNETNKKEKIEPKKDESEEEVEDEVEDAIQKVRNATGCSDLHLISQILEVENYNIDSAIFAILQVNEVKRINAEEQCGSQAKGQKPRSSALWEENGSGSRIFGNQGLPPGGTENNKAQVRPVEETRASKNHFPKVSNKQRKEQQRLEKKRRQEERHRQKALTNKSNNANNNRNETDSNTQEDSFKLRALCRDHASIIKPNAKYLASQELSRTPAEGSLLFILIHVTPRLHQIPEVLAAFWKHAAGVLSHSQIIFSQLFQAEK
ncbi:OTU domain-containing protein 3 isoform A [Alligator mississippiensis]|uniref:OTU domain-containing protein 3 n=1 Tax=Alligator mississippiensis TaxID=8496 RepID=A0A151MJ60_ALLMI|nr:OTU domain-containing protein 3 isoform A [Alligator mississippiensis]